MSRKITNPFGDESDDEDDDFNPFAKKKPSKVKKSISPTPQPPPPSEGKTNPFDGNGNGNTNPFDGNTNPFDEPPAPTKSKASVGKNGTKNNVTKPINSNPFDDDGDNIQQQQKKQQQQQQHPPEQARRTAVSIKKKNHNPFDDDGDGDGDDNVKTRNKNSATALAASVAISGTVPKPLVSQKPQQVERNKTVQTTNRRKKNASAANSASMKMSETSSNNPFDFDDDGGKSSRQSTTAAAAAIAIAPAAETNTDAKKRQPNHTRKKSGFFSNVGVGNNKKDVEKKKTLHNHSATQPILPTMDQEDINSFATGKTSNNHRRNASSVTFNDNISSSKHGGVNNSASSGNNESITNWLRGSTTSASDSGENTKKSIFGTPQRKSIMNHNRNSEKETPNNSISIRGKNSNSDNLVMTTPKRRSPKKKKNYIVKCWPYDNYHNEQKEYYTYLQERELSIAKGTPNNSSPMTITPNSQKKKKNKLIKKRRKEAEAGGGYYSDGGGEGDMTEGNLQPASLNRNKSVGENQLFERPQDLPSIKEAVQNLSLFDFENKAEERAVVIVSTWLFDAGLIDELLANGGNSGASGGRMFDTSADQTITSVKSSEGIEVGVHGHPIEGGLKIDNEIKMLRASAQRELTLINTRLNDGVAASGAEVQEMVNAVQATKMDLGRLRELVSYISSGYKKDGFDANFDSSERGGDGPSEKVKLVLSDFPRLKRAINARRNIFRCFRELEFFSQIPLTCDTLREELHAGEWTEHEWNTIRNVCMEHVKLEILLVEAEAGMKTWLDDEDMEDDASMPSLRSNRSLRKSWKGKQSLTASHYHVVDNFLAQHVKNVWDLGEEIQMRLLSGIGSAFELALNNPAGMVALVEAVEVYEHAAEQYKASHGGDDDESVGSTRNRLQFTNMRAAALAQLYQDFELRGLEVFRAIHMQAADVADEQDALNSQFNAVMRAATELVSEIDVVKNQMAPCFAPHWRVEMLWSACVAHVCSNQIIQQIGGPEGQSLPDLTVTQLLDLVAWVEFFRETIEDAFPSVASINSKKTYFDERPDLFAGDDNEVNMENATDILAWTNNMLWEVHRLAQDEFLLRTRGQVDDVLTKVYNDTHETFQTSEMRLVTNLCENVFALVGVHMRTIRERLTRKSEALVMAVCLIFSQMRSKQISCRDKFLTDLDTCCAAANDFQRMSEQCEDVLQDLIDQCEYSEGAIQMLQESCNALVSLYSGDAVFAAKKAHMYIFEPIWENIADDLFSDKWENEFTHNELALKLTRTLVSAIFMKNIVIIWCSTLLTSTISTCRMISWQTWRHS